MLSITVQYFSNSREDIKYALNLSLRRKGIGAETLTASRDAILSGKHPEMESKLQELNILRMRIAMKALAGQDENETSNSYKETLAEWNKKKENLEVDLANHNSEMGLEQKLRISTLEAITQILPPDSVLLELVKYNFRDFSAYDDNDKENYEKSHYLAFVIYGNQTDNIQMIDLGDSDIIDNRQNFR